MKTNDWIYSELLDLLKEKEKQENELVQQQLELELPQIIEPTIISNKDENNEEINRGVIIIDLGS